MVLPKLENGQMRIVSMRATIIGDNGEMTQNESWRVSSWSQTTLYKELGIALNTAYLGPEAECVSVAKAVLEGNNRNRGQKLEYYSDRKLKSPNPDAPNTLTGWIDMARNGRRSRVLADVQEAVDYIVNNAWNHIGESILVVLKTPFVDLATSLLRATGQDDTEYTALTLEDLVGNQKHLDHEAVCVTIEFQPHSKKYNIIDVTDVMLPSAIRLSWNDRLDTAHPKSF